MTTPKRRVSERDAQIRAIARALLAAGNRQPGLVAKALNISPATMYRRVNGYGKPFTVEELDALAGIFNVPVTSFFDPPDWLLCAVRDLNPEPADYDEAALATVAA